jgi:glycerol-3-phosphate dehydrogenase
VTTEHHTVLVIGGGATGTGIARDLALRGVDTMLVDRDGLASGTSGRSHGLLHSGARYAESDRAGAEECIKENRILRSIAGACLRETDGLFVELDQDDPEYFDQKRAACDAVGIETSLLEPDRVRDRVPGLCTAVRRCMQVPDGVVFPSRLCAANAADADAHGGSVCPNTPVEDLIVENGEITTASFAGDRDDITVDIVVNAAGAWAGRIAEMAGLTVEMAPSRGVMVAVEYDSLGPVLNRCRAPGDGDIVVPHPDQAVLGTTSVPVSGPDAYEKAQWEIERTIRECATMVPPVADRAVERTWWGVRPLYAPDETDRDRRGISRGFVTLDHANDGIANLVSVVGGKLTTYRHMAEVTTDLVCDKLGIEAGCTTAERALPGADDAEKLDTFVAAYDSQGRTDVDIVGRK